MTQILRESLLEDYINISQLYLSKKFIIYRATRRTDSVPVIIKTLRANARDPQEIEILKHEYTLLTHLKEIEGVIHLYEFLDFPTHVALVLEDIAGISLADYLNQQEITIAEFLDISIRLVEILGKIHAMQVVHKDINPSNIVINPKTKQIQIIDFSIANQIDEELHEEINPYFLEGTLAYISPERTGRMNRPTDYRSDFYSLGITFYEMLTKKTPFQSDDPLELIHSHIAKLPPLIPNVPKQLALIIAKLTAKNPDERYSSTLGIKTDLLKCREKEVFPLGENDIKDRLHISHLLYGREKEIQTILNIYREVSKGNLQLLLISGYSGIGKTSLVHEVYKPMTSKHGVFISGKFDQLKRNIPFSAFVEAFNNLIHQILVEPEEQLNIWRQRVLEALSGNGQVIIDVIPSLEMLTGKQPAVQELPPELSQNRFIFTFQNFVRALATEKHPLILFLDDLQWIDSSSLKLLEVLLSDSSLQYFLMVCAYRDNEVSPHHPLTLLLQQLKNFGVPIISMVLSPLTLENVAQLVDDSFPRKAFQSLELATIIYAKTGGNPFFVNQLIKLLYRKHLLKFDYQLQQWVVNFVEISKLEISDNIVELMIQNIQLLTDKSQELLRLAACIGHTFDLQTLALISNKKPNEVATLLWEPIKEGLISGENYKKMDVDPSYGKNIYRFQHDRIQQSAYALIPPELLQETHLAIGRHLLKDWEKQRDPAQLAIIMNHFLKCLGLITFSDEKTKLAHIFYQVGLLAKASTAYQAALEYFKAGISLVDAPSQWQEQYDFLFHLYKNEAECEFLTGKFEEAEQHFNKLLQVAKDRFDKTKIFRDLINMNIKSGRHDLATSLVLDNLKLFNVHLPEKPSKFQVLMEYYKVKWMLRNKKIEELEKIKLMTDPDQFAITEILGSFSELYQYNSNLSNIFVLKSFSIFIKNGYCSYTPASLTSTAMIYLAFSETDLAFKIVDINKKIQEKVIPELKNRSEFIYAGLLTHFKEPVRNEVKLLNDNYKASLDVGDLNYAAYSLTIAKLISFITGTPLLEVKEGIKKSISFLKEIKKDEYREIFAEKFLVVVKYLLGEISLTDEEMEKLISKRAKFENTVNAIGLGIVLELASLMNNSPLVLKIGDLFSRYRTYISNYYFLFHYMVLYALAISELMGSFNNKDRKKYLNKFQKIKKKIQFWSKVSPINFKHMEFLLSAEQARLEGKTQEALDDYDRAIEAAQKSAFINYVALINERAANYLLKHNRKKQARVYIQEAYENYLFWEAKGKTLELEQKFPEILTENSSKATSRSTNRDNLDFLSISKTTQAISEEIIFERLLTKIIQTVLENAAAQRVVILQGQPLQTIASGTLEKVEICDPGTPQKEDISHSVTAYVLRTKQPVILDDASNQPGAFYQDPYFQQNSIKSVLCAPISYRSKVLGILYLENNLVTHAFTHERIKVLNILSAQAAISLENASLYKATERFVPMQFIQELGKNIITEVKLGDQVQCTLTVLFCDIRDFTTISETMSSQQAFDFLNAFFERMEPIISRHGGFIDKYIGDAIMALFPHEADDALNAAIEMLQNLPENVRIGIGINTGELMLGILGSQKRIESSVIGDTVNIAARLEVLTKSYQAPILISDSVKQKLKHPSDHILRLIEEDVIVKGKTIAFPLWEVCDADPPEVRIAKIETMNLYNQARKAWSEKRLELAIASIEKILKLNPKDSVAAYWLKKMNL